MVSRAVDTLPVIEGGARVWQRDYSASGRRTEGYTGAQPPGRWKLSLPEIPACL
jgi:hypothetical protein